MGHGRHTPREQYSKEDLEIGMDNLLAVVRATIKRDLAEANHGAVILLKQILEQAEARASRCAPTWRRPRTARCWRRWRGGRRRSSRRAARRRRSRRAPPPRAPTRLGQIGRMQDPKLVADLERATEANAQLAERVAKLRAQAETVGVDKGALAGRIADGSAATAAAYDSAAAASGAAALRAQVGALEAELAAVREAAAEAAAARRRARRAPRRARRVAGARRRAGEPARRRGSEASRASRRRTGGVAPPDADEKNVLVKRCDTLIANGIQP